jgi:hypothetical protein
MIGRLLFGAALAGAVGFGYPLWNEHAASSCQALEQRMVAMAAPPGPAGLAARAGHALQLAVVRQWLEPVSGGALAAAEMKQRYPGLPPEIGCAAAYWTSLLDPRVQQAVQRAVW